MKRVREQQQNVQQNRFDSRLRIEHQPQVIVIEDDDSDQDMADNAQSPKLQTDPQPQVILDGNDLHQQMVNKSHELAMQIAAAIDKSQQSSERVQQNPDPTVTLPTEVICHVLNFLSSPKDRKAFGETSSRFGNASKMMPGKRALSAPAAWFELCLGTVVERKVTGNLRYLALMEVPSLWDLVNGMTQQVKSGAWSKEFLCQLLEMRWRDMYNYLLNEYEDGAYSTLVVEVDGLLSDDFKASNHTHATSSIERVYDAIARYNKLLPTQKMPDKIPDDIPEDWEKLRDLPMTFHHNERIVNHVMKHLVQMRMLLMAYACLVDCIRNNEPMQEDANCTLKPSIAKLHAFLLHFDEMSEIYVDVSALLRCFLRFNGLDDVIVRSLDHSCSIEELRASNNPTSEELCLLWLFEHYDDNKEVQEELFEQYARDIELKDRQWNYDKMHLVRFRPKQWTIKQLLQTSVYWPLFQEWHLRPSNFSSLHTERISGLSQLGYHENWDRIDIKNKTLSKAKRCKWKGEGSHFLNAAKPLYNFFIDNCSYALNMNWMFEVRGITHFVDMNGNRAEISLWTSLCSSNRISCELRQRTSHAIQQCKERFFQWRTPDVTFKVDRWLEKWDHLTEHAQQNTDHEVAIHCCAGQGRTGIMLARTLIQRHGCKHVRESLDLLSMLYRPQSTKEVLYGIHQTHRYYRRREQYHVATVHTRMGLDAASKSEIETALQDMDNRVSESDHPTLYDFLTFTARNLDQE